MFSVRSVRTRSHGHAGRVRSGSGFADTIGYISSYMYVFTLSALKPYRISTTRRAYGFISHITYTHARLKHTRRRMPSEHQPLVAVARKPQAHYAQRNIGALPAKFGHLPEKNTLEKIQSLSNPIEGCHPTRVGVRLARMREPACPLGSSELGLAMVSRMLGHAGGLGAGPARGRDAIEERPAELWGRVLREAVRCRPHSCTWRTAVRLERCTPWF